MNENISRKNDRLFVVFLGFFLSLVLVSSYIKFSGFPEKVAAVEGTLTIGNSLQGNLNFQGNLNLPGNSVWKSSGKVGIGVTNPSSLLSVGGTGGGYAIYGGGFTTAYQTGIYGGGSQTGVYGYGVVYGLYGQSDDTGVAGTGTNYGGYFTSNGTAAFISGSVWDVWAPTGRNYFGNNVGIGTSNPVSNLSVGGTGFANAAIYGTGTSYGVYGNSILYGVMGRGNVGVYGNGTTYDFYASNSSKKSVFSGNVGIGTDASGHRLHVAGDENLTGHLHVGEYLSVGASANISSTLTVTGTATFNSTQTNMVGQLYMTGNATRVNMRGNSPTIYWNGSDYSVWMGIMEDLDGSYEDELFQIGMGSVLGTYPKISINYMGSVGIGATTLSHTLNVGGNARITQSVDVADDRTLCTSNATGSIEFKNGACGTSALRFKENIYGLSYGLKEINLLRPVFFNYKDFDENNPGGRTKRRIGLIAEETAEVIPEIVLWNEEGFVDSIDYPYLAPLLIKGIQQQQTQINKLKIEINELKKAVDELNGK